MCVVDFVVYEVFVEVGCGFGVGFGYFVYDLCVFYYFVDYGVGKYVFGGMGYEYVVIGY